MTESPDEEFLYDAFDKFLEAQFKGHTLDPSHVAGEHEDQRDGVDRAAHLAEWVVSPPRDVLPSHVEGYRILREVGHGSMGTVFLAYHEKLRREVALKVLPHASALSERSRRRFFREARTMASLEDDHVVRVYDVIEQGSLLAYAMEWVDGPSLREVLSGLRLRGHHTGTAGIDEIARVLGADVGSLGDRSAVQFWLRTGIAVARAMQRVHDTGLVHRDVKPANILLRKDGQPLLADFGLVREVDSSLTRTTGFVGTQGYAPPEQLGADSGSSDEPEDSDATALADPVDHRADIYALGATLYECFAGAPPFAGIRPAKLLNQLETVGARPLRKVTPRAPRDLEIVLEKAMSPDREDRYAGAADFADDLERVLELKSIHARRAGFVTRGWRALRFGHPALVGGLVGAALVIILAGVWLDAQDREERSLGESMSHLHAARELLVRPGVRTATWRAMHLGFVDAAQFEAAQELRNEAVRHYGESLERDPQHLVEVERDAVQVALDLRELTTDGFDEADLARAYPALAEGSGDMLGFIVRRIAAAPAGQRVTRVAISRQPSVPDELIWKVGLMAHLAGDDSVCEDIWLPLGEDDREWPLLDVALARQFLDDGRFGLALPRLLRAVERFPENETLELDLASVYLELGDVGSALRVLGEIESELADSHRCRLLRASADLDRDPAAALEDLRVLAAEQPDSEDAAFRLATQEHRLGNGDVALGLLQRIVESAPEVTRYRLSLARLAVQRGETELYLDQVRYVLRSDFGIGRSFGITRDLLDVLQVGGLAGLYAKGVEITRRSGSPDIVGLPGSAWEKPPYGSRQQVEAALLAER